MITRLSKVNLDGLKTKPMNEIRMINMLYGTIKLKRFALIFNFFFISQIQLYSDYTEFLNIVPVL